MTRVLNHLRHQAVAYVALFIALGGTGYAATRLPAGSVGTRALKNHSITPDKLDRNSIAGYLRAYVEINPQGQIVESHPAATLIPDGTASQPGYLIEWSSSMASSCFALATSQLPSQATSASAYFVSGGKSNAGTYVRLSAPDAVAVAVMCPQP